MATMEDWNEPDEEEEPTEDEYAFMEWCEEVMQQLCDQVIIDDGYWLHSGACAVKIEITGGIGFWSTCVLPSGSDVALAQWLRF